MFCSLSVRDSSRLSECLSWGFQSNSISDSHHRRLLPGSGAFFYSLHPPTLLVRRVGGFQVLLSEKWLPEGGVQGVSGGEAVFKLASASPVVILSLVSAHRLCKTELIIVMYPSLMR